MKVTIDGVIYPDIPYGAFMYPQEILIVIGRKRYEYDLYVKPPANEPLTKRVPDDQLLSSSAEYISVPRKP